MFAYSQIEPNRLGTVSRWDIPLNLWMGLKWEHGYESTMGRALTRMTEDFLEDGELLSPDDLNEQWGIRGEGGLAFKEPMTAGRAQLMHERKRAELDRLHYLEAGKHGWFSAKAAAGFGAGLVGGLSHPLDVGISFVPLFGQASKGAQMAKAGAGALRQRMARGLIATEDDLVRAGVPFPRVSASMMEGMLGNAIAEVPVFIQNARDQAIYGLEDSAINVLAGGAFAGVVRGLGRALERAVDLYMRLDERVQAAAEAKAASDFLNSRPIEVESIVRVDEAAIRERVRFDEAKARREALSALDDPTQRAIDQLATLDVPDGVEVRIAGSAVGTGPKGVKESPNDIDVVLKVSDDVYFSEHDSDFWRLADALAQQEGIDVWVQSSGEITRLTPGTSRIADRLTMPNQSAAATLANAIPASRVNRAELLATHRESRIRDLVESKRREWDEEARFKAEVEKEIARQQSQGKLLPQEEIDKRLAKETLEDADIAAIKEDVATLEKELMADPERPLTETQLKQLDQIKSHEKALNAAVPCVIQSLINDA